MTDEANFKVKITLNNGDEYSCECHDRYIDAETGHLVLQIDRKRTKQIHYKWSKVDCFMSVMLKEPKDVALDIEAAKEKYSGVRYPRALAYV